MRGKVDWRSSQVWVRGMDSPSFCFCCSCWRGAGILFSLSSRPRLECVGGGGIESLGGQRRPAEAVCWPLWVVVLVLVLWTKRRRRLGSRFRSELFPPSINPVPPPTFTSTKIHNLPVPSIPSPPSSSSSTLPLFSSSRLSLNFIPLHSITKPNSLQWLPNRSTRPMERPSSPTT